MPVGTTDIHDPSEFGEGGQGTIAYTRTQIPPEASGKLHYIVNNLPYSIALENGHSGQAPQGMVGLTVTEYQTIVQRAVEDLNQ